MMKKYLLTFLVLLFSLPLHAQTLKIATVTPEGSSWMKDMRASAAEIKERTDGRVQIKYYGGGVMGNDQKVMSRIRLRSLQGGAFTPTALVGQYPDLNLYGMPLVFESVEEAEYVRAKLDDRIEQGLEDAGWVNFGFAAGGFANLLSNTPISRLEDLKGKKVWVPEGDSISLKSMQALSLTPVSLPMTDVLTGLQTGLIDIVGMPPVGALVLQWHTKVKYITEFPLSYTMGFMAVDKRAFDKISPEDQVVVREVMERTYRGFNEQNLEDSDEALQALLNSGIERVAVDPAEYERVRTLLLESNRAIGAEGNFSMDLYEEMLGYIEEYRSGQQASAGPAN